MESKRHMPRGRPWRAIVSFHPTPNRARGLRAGLRASVTGIRPERGRVLCASAANPRRRRGGATGQRCLPRPPVPVGLAFAFLGDEL